MGAVRADWRRLVGPLRKLPADAVDRARFASADVTAADEKMRVRAVVDESDLVRHPVRPVG
jgi:hypothetical protein